MDLQIRPLPFDPARLRGLPETLILSHHQNNYAGAARRLNALRAQLAGMSFGQARGFSSTTSSARSPSPPTRCCCTSSTSPAWAAAGRPVVDKPRG